MTKFKGRVRIDGGYAEVIIDANYYNNAKILLESQYGSDNLVFLNQVTATAEEQRAAIDLSRAQQRAEAADRQAGVDRARAEEAARKAEFNPSYSNETHAPSTTYTASSHSGDYSVIDMESSFALRVAVAVPTFFVMAIVDFGKDGLEAAIVYGGFWALAAFLMPGLAMIALAWVVGKFLINFWQAHTWYELFVYPIVVLVGIHYFWTEVVTKESEKAVD